LAQTRAAAADSILQTTPVTQGLPTSSWQSLGAVVLISGVGFWDFPHGQTGAARNYAELHPVTGIRFISGCA
jgi:hypothetical protein